MNDLDPVTVGNHGFDPFFSANYLLVVLDRNPIWGQRQLRDKATQRKPIRNLFVFSVYLNLQCLFLY
jgi:hypothetical protein